MRQDAINRRAWSRPSALERYRIPDGYETEGERLVVAELERRHAGGRILDLGCGGGRTAHLLKPFAGDYLGIDYTAPMIPIARGNHPDLRFAHMDARDLSPLESGRFDAVLFSYNGLDSIGPEGRLAALSEAARVLRPGGSFAFSSFNRNWYGFQLATRPHTRRPIWAANPARLAYRLARWGAVKLRERRYLALEQRGEHAILLHAAHEFGIMIYATTPTQIRQQLGAAGFAPDVTILRKDGGAPVDETEAGTEYFHVIARKAPADTP